MEIEIENMKENKLLDRVEINFKLVHEGGTPSRKRIRDSLSEKLGEKNKIIIIEWMRSRYGVSETLGYAKAYPSKTSAEKIEGRHILKRNFGEAKKSGEKSGEKPGEKSGEKPEGGNK
jgi:ribosomal protein S24E